MHIKTILNQITDHKSFVFGKVTWRESSSRLALEVEVKPRANGRPICSGCDRPRPGYDRSPEPRRFEFIPVWGIMVSFVYRMRRVDCPTGCKTGGFLGFSTAEPGRFRSDRCGRGAVAARPSIPDRRVSTGRRPQTLALDWSGSDCQDLVAVLPFPGKGTQLRIAIRVQRHVAGLQWCTHAMRSKIDPLILQVLPPVVETDCPDRLDVPCRPLSSGFPRGVRQGHFGAQQRTRQPDWRGDPTRPQLARLRQERGEMAGDTLNTKDAARQLGIARATLYGWLAQSDAGQFMVRGQPVTIDYFQGGRGGQGRIRIETAEIERLRALMRVKPRRIVSQKPLRRAGSFPGIHVKLGDPAG